MYVFFRLSAIPSSQFCEKTAHQLPALLGSDSPHNDGAGMKNGSVHRGKPPLGIGRSIDHTPDLAPGTRTGTHHAGLHGDIEGAILQVLAAQRRSRSSNGLHLGMGRGIAQKLHQIVPTAHYPLTANHHGTYGDLSSTQRLARLRYCQGHKKIILFLLRIHIKLVLLGLLKPMANIGNCVRYS